jgi:hypothetical protein
MSTPSGALGFLSSGTTPGQSQQESESTSSLPSWYTDATQSILNKANQWANSGYQAYQGPQVAAQSDLTKQAAAASAGVGAGALAGSTAAQNLVNNGVGQVENSVAPGQGGLAAAGQYLNSASNPTYNTVGNYMNPYNNAVTNAIAQQGATDFQTKTMPALQSSIIGGGNITGSSTEGAQLAGNAAAGAQQGISAAQAAALQSGYGQSLNAAQAGATLQGQLANTAGQLGTQQQTAMQNAGTDIINAGSTSGQLNNLNTQQQIAAQQNQNTFGNQQQGETQANYNAAIANFNAQNNWPLTGASAIQGALAGMQVPTTTTNYGASTGTPATIGNSPIADIGSSLTQLGTLANTTGTPQTQGQYDPTTGTYKP